MSFTTYYVDADLAQHSDTVAGVSCVCHTYQEANQEAARLERNARYVNVRITPVRHGC